MTGESSSRTQPILLVTGLSGAGKTTALRELEDIGWEAIDNFPVRLLDRLVGETQPGTGDMAGPLAIGFDSRTRGFVPTEIIAQVKRMGSQGDLDITTLFLDCAGDELERRYNENRRRHPLAGDLPVATGIAAERDLLAPLRRWADVLIDTTAMSTNALQTAIREQFAGPPEGEIIVTVSSFGYSRGMPPLADLVFDMRFVENPHWEDGLRDQTGLDDAVGDYIERDEGFASAFPKIRDLVLDLLPRYARQGKRYCHIAFGCTGGRHRSVYSAQRLAQALRAAGFSPTTLHRNLGSRAADMIEGTA
jgi:UPF0042 nucleotide-binding protein